MVGHNEHSAEPLNLNKYAKYVCYEGSLETRSILGVIAIKSILWRNMIKLFIRAGVSKSLEDNASDVLMVKYAC